MHATKALAEADRLMTVCNSCRYCEGLCAVFPAMEMRRVFNDGDLRYLANLCHGCGACYYDCQFSPPHEFNVNVPKVLAEVRAQSYAHYARPRTMMSIFGRSGVAGAGAVAVTVLFAALLIWHDPTAFFSNHVDPGAFYRLLPHEVMVAIFGAAFLFAIVTIGLGLLAFWREVATANDVPAVGHGVLKATHDAATLRYLDGGGSGCMNEGETPDDRRRFYHHLAFYGFLLCFASTSVATLYHYLLGREAPYPWWDLPVVLGSLGGIGLVAGSVGLIAADRKRDRALKGDDDLGFPFNTALFILGATGLLLLWFRETAAMGTLLALHLGAVLSFFLTMPYGKFVHGLYRYLALVRYARERKVTRHE